ncbi:MAG: T9SS type A sorting domain-containing protein [Dysgonamonadaceae bacterium]|nr:T9SS type A sorting domain-containing protein [Dysgonamonadaceae bacterium]
MKAIYHTALPVLAGLIFLSAAYEAKGVMPENEAEIKFFTTVLGGCNDWAALRNDDQSDKDTVVISTIADSIHVFVRHNYICSAPFKTECEIKDDSIFMYIIDTCEKPFSCYDRCDCYYTFDFKFVRQGDKNYPYKIVLSDPRENEPLTISEGIILETPPVNTAEVLLLKVDYTTNRFEGGQKLQFTPSPETLTVRTEHEDASDYGWIKVYFAEIDELLFYGDIIWLGCGDIIYPATWRNADDFELAGWTNYITPSNGFENIFNTWKENYDYNPVWGAVQGILEVRQMLETNPLQRVKLFLYTPSVGMGNPEDWKWIIFLAGGNFSQNIITKIELTPQSPVASDSVFLTLTSDLFGGGCTYTSDVDSIVENTIYVSGKYDGLAKCSGKIDNYKIYLGKFKQGNYSVTHRLIDINEFYPTETYTLSFEVSAPDYIQGPEVESSNSVWINPVNEKSWLISSLSPMQEIRIYDAKGMLVFKQNTEDCLHYTLNGQSLQSGIYLINISMQNGISERKKLIVR